MDPKLIFGGLLMVGAGVWYLSQNATPTVPVPKMAVAEMAESSDRSLNPFKRKRKTYDGSNPEVLRKTELFGEVWISPAVALADNGLAIVPQVIDGPTPDAARGMPAAIVSLTAPQDCALRPTGAEEQVHTVSLVKGAQPTSLHAYSDGLLARGALRGLVDLKKNPGRRIDSNAAIPEYPQNTRMQLTDLVVNLPGDPVHLVLQTRASGVVWNLLPAEGTRIAHVTLVSNGPVAVANLPDGASIEGLDLPNTKSCGGIKVGIPLQADDVARETFQMTGLKNRHRQALRSDPYEDWFERTFAIPAGYDGVVVGQAAHILLGEAPKTPVAHKGLEGTTLHIIPDELTYAATPEQHSAFMQDRSVQMLALAFGVPPETDLAALIRNPVAATAQEN